MKKKPVGIMARRRQAMFMRRTYQMYRAFLERLKESGAMPARIPVTKEEFRNLCAMRMGILCCYCRAEVTVRNFSLDHIVPLSRGGADHPDNWRIICAPCNKAKGQFTQNEFMSLLWALDELTTKYSDDRIEKHVLSALKVANSFRIGANRRALHC